MNNSEDLSLLFPNSPFIKVGVACFDIVAGIKVTYRWDLLKNDESYFSKITFDEIFKMNLCNVHRQEEKYYQDIKISKLELPPFGIYMISSIFIVNINSKNTHFSLGIIMKVSDIKNNLHFNNYLTSKMLTLSGVLRNYIIESSPYSQFTPYLKDFLLNITKITLSMNKSSISDYTKQSNQGSNHSNIANKSVYQHDSNNSTSSSDQKVIVRNNIIIPNEKMKKINYNLALENDTVCDFSEIDFSFLAILLTSHIQTQMTTVIECQNIKMAHCIAMFLDRFLLQSQREMSSLEIHECPIPGLFLQFVYHQKTARNKMMAMVDRPTTWARLSDQTIEQIIPITDVILNSNASSDFISHVNQISIKTPAPWACKTVQLVQQAPTSKQIIICDIQMKDIVWSAASYSILAQSIPQTQAQILKPWTWSIFAEKSSPGLPLNVLGPSNLSHEEDLKLVASISQLLDLWHPKVPK